MSKKVKNILLFLVVICLASIVLNIVQYTGNTTQSGIVNDSTAIKQQDSINILKVEVKKQKVRIAELNKIINNYKNK